MGIATKISIGDALFSKVQQKVLALIFSEPTRTFYKSEIVRRVGSGTGAVERELSRLERSGLVRLSRVGNQLHYQANESAPVFSDLRSLIMKTAGLAGPLREALQPIALHITAAFVFGSVARRTDTAHSDIDIMVISDDLDYSDLYRHLKSAEEKLQRPVNPTMMSLHSWRRRLAEGDPFVQSISAGERMFLIGEEGNLTP